MPVHAHAMWNSLCFYKAYLPPEDTVRATGYVVLALEEPEEGEEEVSPVPRENSNERGVSPSLSHLDWPDDGALFPGDRLTAGAATNSSQLSDLLPSHERSVMDRDTKLQFFLFRKEDVSPPYMKGMLGKIRHCFLLCLQGDRGNPCHCHRAHLLNEDAWRLKLSSFDFSTLCVSSNFSLRYIDVTHVRPTAGFLFTCGLLHERIIVAAQPILCRYNDKCRYGSQCLFVHADIGGDNLTKTTAATPLRNLLPPQEGLDTFLAQLEEVELQTVGDVQRLSTKAFDAFVGGCEPQWTPLWLNISIFREIQPKASLESVLISFPGVTAPVVLPPNLTNVLSLLDMSQKDFYKLKLTINVQAACEKIRARFWSSRDYRTLDLKREGAKSFFTNVTLEILQFRSTMADCSWRKKDPMRQVVTSLMTYVDHKKCHCNVTCGSRRHWSMHKSALSSNGNGMSNATFPDHSWCTCPRSTVMAVNYELSTPSGSRCSEQNALGKLASMGLPTCAVREVFVHGEHQGSKKDPNPLFPCGVCENMLRKVAHDVLEIHGGDVMLYMYDSTHNPKRLVYLPITEISYRDDMGFREFVADLHE
ncbi:hypothetical protein, conserved [Trypanosoma brucei gambiense DAL972]|uniref:Uncharacterized protein n=1 Tax=Trypanosoma brucei gambiense (strain MHOM/CI/86/DAL972) TaxID=679716 RepID=D0A3Z2_TRYB9|nr:hypothetical protein, conserved [Trypanosoma brucei gambiense DAL972]CBH15986.1 hypothetical protein, conserved [Trypanosoma brucei gambiense DAL972]|eukprot:XP_011778250.1 hypothetical protein, conserved [Trypanosoma brucei gambiense DAL972]